MQVGAHLRHGEMEDRQVHHVHERRQGEHGQAKPFASGGL